MRPAFEFRSASAKNSADILTKLLEFLAHWDHVRRLGMDYVDEGMIVFPADDD